MDTISRYVTYFLLAVFSTLGVGSISSAPTAHAQASQPCTNCGGIGSLPNPVFPEIPPMICWFCGSTGRGTGQVKRSIEGKEPTKEFTRFSHEKMIRDSKGAPKNTETFEKIFLDSP